jgi:predicted DNA-binding transcriptional regulator YafY
VGQRSNTETLAAILKAFLEQSTWKQADLARHVGVQPAALRKQLDDLLASGVPLASEKEHPHVYWSVPKSWYPGGVLFTGDQITELFRLLSRLPKSKGRDQLIETLIKYMPARDSAMAIIPPETSSREEQHLSAIEDAARTKVALRFRYFTANRGAETSRHASVHRVFPSPPARFLATCHKSGSLKWFRVESVSEAKLDKSEPFRAVEEAALDAHVRASLDGFHQGGEPVRHVFFVSEPEARWVARNLMEGMECEEVPGGIRVSLETTAVQRLARFVVGLGGAAKVLTKQLEGEVASLATGALSGIEAK